MANDDKTTNRRQFLTKVGVGSVAVGIGTIGLAGCQQGHESKSDRQTEHTPKPNSPPTNPKQAGEQNTNVKHCLADNQYDFYGKHQAGIITPAQRSIYFLVLDLHTDKLDDIKEVFKQWTQYAARLTKGDNIAPYGSNPHVPPVDTGEADSLGAYGLTLTFGISPSFLQKLNLTDKKPPEFSDSPKFPRDQIRPEYSGAIFVSKLAVTIHKSAFTLFANWYAKPAQALVCDGVSRDFWVLIQAIKPLVTYSPLKMARPIAIHLIMLINMFGFNSQTG